MNYFKAIGVTEEYSDERLYEYDGKIEKGDFVIVPNYDDKPISAEVVEIVSRHSALTSYQKPVEVICKVNMKEFNAKREKEIDDRILLDKMQDKVSQIQMLEKLEKYAGKDPEMLELLNQFKGTSQVQEDED